MSHGQVPSGVFRGEVDCDCGFILDEYEDRWHLEYADPDTGLVVDRCPQCGHNLNLFMPR